MFPFNQDVHLIVRQIYTDSKRFCACLQKELEHVFLLLEMFLGAVGKLLDSVQNTLVMKGESEDLDYYSVDEIVAIRESKHLAIEKYIGNIDESSDSSTYLA